MGLITQEVEIPVHPTTVKYFESLGYKLPKRKDKFGKDKYDFSLTIKIKILDLPKGSHFLINCCCDGENCKTPEMNNIMWKNYIRSNRDGKIYCSNCAHKLFAGETLRINRLKKSITIKDWSIKNNKKELLKRCGKDNLLKPDQLSFKSNKFIYVDCNINKNHKPIYAPVRSLTNKNSLLECKECNLLGNYFPEVVKIWSLKNNDTPFDHYKSENSVVWWECSDKIHSDYTRTINGSNAYGFRCPECVRERTESFLQEMTRKYLNELGYKLNHEKNCKLLCYNPQTNYRLFYDNEIIHKKFKLIVEVHGPQHYVIEKWNSLTAKHNNTTPELELSILRKRDKIKKNEAIRNDYFYLEIPYWAFETNKWKKLIDNKLKECLSKEN